MRSSIFSYRNTKTRLTSSSVRWRNVSARKPSASNGSRRRWKTRKRKKNRWRSWNQCSDSRSKRSKLPLRFSMITAGRANLPAVILFSVGRDGILEKRGKAGYHPALPLFFPGWLSRKLARRHHTPARSAEIEDIQDQILVANPFGGGL